MKSAAVLLVLSLAILAACSRREQAAADSSPGEAQGSGHAHKSLMGGQLVAIGDHQFNLEFKYDVARGVLQAWVLDGHAENFVRVSMALFDVQEAGGQKRTITLRALANEMTGEKTGDSSSFEGEAAWLGGTDHFDGVVKAIKVREGVFRDITFHFHPKG